MIERVSPRISAEPVAMTPHITVTDRDDLRKCNSPGSSGLSRLYQSTMETVVRAFNSESMELIAAAKIPATINPTKPIGMYFKMK